MLVLITCYFLLFCKTTVLVNLLLFCYTNVYLNNYFYICIVWCLAIFNKTIYKNTIALVVCMYLPLTGVSAIPNIPLLNSFFLIHPFLLYIMVGYLIYMHLSNLSYNKFSIYLLYLSLVMGGVWSLQEFNWGGWWNWDLLELFILLNIVYVTFKTHKIVTYINFFKHSIIFFKIFLFLVLYFLFNKWGLSISIHSFSKSIFFKNYFYYYLTIALIFIQLYLYKNYLLILYLVIYLYIYLNITNLIFIKFIFLYAYIFYNPIRFKNNCLAVLHYLSKSFLFSVVVFNFFNNLFYIIVFKASYIGGFFIDMHFVKLLLVDFSNLLALKLYSSFFFFKPNSMLVTNYLVTTIANHVTSYIYSYYYYIPINFFIFFFIRK